VRPEVHLSSLQGESHAQWPCVRDKSTTSRQLLVQVLDVIVVTMVVMSGKILCHVLLV